ncbi:CbiX/SirB N-terminal domain-containing protein [Cyanobium sp. ATX 6F1]|uniref:CbiX/SirB N-terminal domain-containing protein n=1 Tax=Cyanobium sp. ATX 6F1 TaxID=2823702 RepID=UPI0020CBEFD9|nr:CbiX/SirB N-terminal domain-containing protein [Cyanobium sp. ATX 6F1]MCP9917738.1 hypothetical protein [Cyanobium sp. ATX 6F1]
MHSFLNGAPADPPLPALLPPPGDGGRWPLLQQLRRLEPSELEPWLRALEAGSLASETDLLAVLADRLEGADAARLLVCWLNDHGPGGSRFGAPGEAEQLALIGRRRHPACARALRQAVEELERADLPLSAALLPPLGLQRDGDDFPLLARLAGDPGSRALRRGALEGLAVGLSAWPLAPLRQLLERLAEDLDGILAAQAVDLLARLPAGRAGLARLARRPLDPAVGARLHRRLAAAAASPLLLVVHGRSEGVIPPELLELAETLERRRGAPVRFQALTAATAVAAPAGTAMGNRPPWLLVPLLLLPGGHVRHDVPAIATAWRQAGPLRRLPFLGAWPAWQRALRAELAERAEQVQVTSVSNGLESPRLLHHPVEGELGQRYLRHLSKVTGAICVASPYSAADLEALTLAIPTGALPLTLAANRLTDSLGALLGPPLLQRPRFRALLLELLGELP